MATIDNPRAIRVKTSTGWADLVIQGPPGPPGEPGAAGMSPPLPHVFLKDYPADQTLFLGGNSQVGYNDDGWQRVASSSAHNVALPDIDLPRNSWEEGAAVTALMLNGTAGGTVRSVERPPGFGSLLILLNKSAVVPIIIQHNRSGGAYDMLYMVDNKNVTLQPNDSITFIWDGRWREFSRNITTGFSTYSNFSAGPPQYPVDGQLWYARVAAGGSPIWTFRYNAASTSVHKWEFVGGAPMSITNQGYGGSQVGIWTPFNGNAWAVERPGEYWAEGVFSGYSPPASNLGGIMVTYNNANYNGAVITFQSTENASNYFIVTVGKTLVVTDNLTTTLALAYYFGGAVTAMYGIHTAVTPIRVS